MARLTEDEIIARYFVWSSKISRELRSKYAESFLVGFIKNVVEEELTEVEKGVLLPRILEDSMYTEIAKDKNRNISSIHASVKRAKTKVERALKYLII